MFGFFRRKDFYDTAKEICDVYNKEISLGNPPKEALVSAMSRAMQFDKNLKHMSPMTYCANIFGKEFEDLGKNEQDTPAFVRKAILNIICSYLHPECNPMHYALDFSEQNPSTQLKNVVNYFIKS